jgi:hypothetical protein
MISIIIPYGTTSRLFAHRYGSNDSSHKRRGNPIKTMVYSSESWVRSKTARAELVIDLPYRSTTYPNLRRGEMVYISQENGLILSQTKLCRGGIPPPLHENQRSSYSMFIARSVD